MDHRAGFVAGDARGDLEVYLHVARHHAHEQTSPVAAQHQRLEHPLDGLSELLGDMVYREVAFVDLVGYEFEVDARSLQKAGGVGLVNSHSVCDKRG